MKKMTIVSLLFFLYFSASAQFVATMEIKEDIPGICNKKGVYVLFSMMKGQEEAVCPVTKDSIVKRLNNEVIFLKENGSYDDKGMVNIIINCKGVVVKCQMDNKTKSEELDKQIVAVFNSLGSWKAARLNGKEVDSSRLWSFEIKTGKITVK